MLIYSHRSYSWTGLAFHYSRCLNNLKFIFCRNVRILGAILKRKNNSVFIITAMQTDCQGRRRICLFGHHNDEWTGKQEGT